MVYRESEEAETGRLELPDSEETLALGASKPKTATAVEKTWEQIKQQEKDGNERVLAVSQLSAFLLSRLIAFRTRLEM